MCSPSKGEHRRLTDSIKRMFPEFLYDSDYLPERDNLWPTEETTSDAQTRATRVLDRIFQSESQKKRCKPLNSTLQKLTRTLTNTNTASVVWITAHGGIIRYFMYVLNFQHSNMDIPNASTSKHLYAFRMM